jgi:hypothetical protein
MVVIARDTKLPIARAAAIDAHANFEQALFTLFASLLGAPRDRAGIVFFRIASAPTRNKILESLLKKTHGNKYKVYWNGCEPKAQDGLFPLIRQLDHRRNELVHWHIAMEIRAGDGSAISREALEPPNFWNIADNRPKITVKDLENFVQKADFVTRSVAMFYALTSGDLPGVVPGPWPEIFEQPILYPPPETHPLFRNYKGRETPPESWPG